MIRMIVAGLMLAGWALILVPEEIKHGQALAWRWDRAATQTTQPIVIETSSPALS